MIDKLKSVVKSILRKKIVRNTRETEFFIKKLGSNILTFKTVFDVGSYHGSFVDSIAEFNPNINFHCFEPFSESFFFLEEKFKINPNVIINNMAASDENGQRVLNINSFTETNSLLESLSVDNTIDRFLEKKGIQEVSVIKLSDYCFQKKIEFIDLVKIDAQGNSYNILKGLSCFLSSKNVRYLYVEAEFVEIYQNEKLFAEIDILMRGFGYQIIDLYNLNYLSNGRLGWCDILYGIK
jgi:FkbM family methyltransferase